MSDLDTDRAGAMQFAVGDLVRIEGVRDVGEVTGFSSVDSYRYGRRYVVVVRYPDGRRFEQPASELRLAEETR